MKTYKNVLIKLSYTNLIAKLEHHEKEKHNLF